MTNEIRLCILTSNEQRRRREEVAFQEVSREFPAGERGQAEGKGEYISELRTEGRKILHRLRRGGGRYTAQSIRVSVLPEADFREGSVNLGGNTGRSPVLRIGREFFDFKKTSVCR